MQPNVILIGMPASGKSTLGRLLAQELGMTFLDTDDLIRQREGRELQEILNQEGMEAFLRREEAAILALQTQNTVIATGGSVVYSRPAMARLKAQGVCVYLQLPFSVIRHRLRNLATRGVAMAQGQTLEALYRERVPLYETWSDLTFSTGRRDYSPPKRQARRLAQALRGWMAGRQWQV